MGYMDRPKQEVIAIALKDQITRVNILSTLNESGDFQNSPDFIQAVSVLKLKEIQRLAEITPATIFFFEHWDHLSPETQQAFSLNS